ncbi:MAG: hypothetical protein ACRDQT_02620 [Gaiellaceae bacterium]
MLRRLLGDAIMAAMALFRRRDRKQADREVELNREAVDHVLSGGDIHEGSPFYEKVTPEEGVHVEMLFGKAGMSIASYVVGRSTPMPSKEEQAATMLLADAAAKAEFHLRCQKADADAVEGWLVGENESRWDGLLSRFPALADRNKDAFVADARGLIDRNWVNVMTMASAYAHSQSNVEGREDEFLNTVYVDPDDAVSQGSALT